MRIGPDETSPSRSGRKRGMESRRQAVKAFVGTSSRFFVSLAAGEKKNGHREPSRRPCDRASLVANATLTSSQERCRPVGAITMSIGRREGCQRRERRLQLSLARSSATTKRRLLVSHIGPLRLAFSSSALRVFSLPPLPGPP